MIIKHKFLSPSAVVVLGKVGGQDWNDDHCYGPGAIIPIAHASIWWDATGSVGEVFRSQNLGLFSKSGDGVISAALARPDVPLADGSAVSYQVHFSPSPNGALPAGWYLSCVCSGEVNLSINIFVHNASDVPTDLPINCDFSLTVNAIVVAV